VFQYYINSATGGSISHLISEESLNSSLDSSEQASEAGSGSKGKGAAGMCQPGE
jgi:hypothetical protein